MLAVVRATLRLSLIHIETDVGVPHRADPVRGGVRRRGQHTRELLPRPPGRTAHVLQVDGVQRPLDGPQDLPAARRLLRHLGHQLTQHLQVLRQLPHRPVQDRQVHPRQPVAGAVVGRLPVAQLGGYEGAVVEDHGIGGGLHVQQDRLAAHGPVGDPHPLVAGVEALHRRPVRAVDQPLALETRHVLVEPQVQQRLDRTARPPLGHRPRHGEPAGAPGRPPRGTHLDGRARGRQALGDGHRLARGVPHGDAQRHRLRVHGRADPLVQHPPETGFGDGAVVVHASP